MTELPATWTRVFKVWWLLLWRSFIIGVLGGAFFGAVVGIIGTLMDMPADFLSLFAQVVGYLAGNAAFLFMVKSAFKKQFKGFRLAMVPIDAFTPSETAPPPRT